MKARFIMANGNIDYFNDLIGVEAIDNKYVLTFEDHTLTIDTREVRSFTVVTQ